MRTIIAGSRDCTDMKILETAIANITWQPSVVISGTARGADTLGELWAAKNNIPIERKPANWKQYGQSAGYKRNREMAESAEALIALWDGNSRGTLHMIEQANKKQLLVYVFEYKK